MSADNHGALDETARAELAAIDAALHGQTVSGAQRELGELALLLREDRPRPAPHFVARLDERVERGELRLVSRQAPPAGHGHGGRARRALLARGGAVGVLAALIVILAIPATIALLAGGAGQRAQSAASARAARTAGPAVTRQSADEVAEQHAKAPATTSGGLVAVPRPNAAKAEATAASAASTTAGRAVQRTTALELGVPSRRLEAIDQQVFSITSAFRGYVLQSSSTSGSQQQGSASFQLRVPSASVSGALTAISQLGRVLSETNTTNDVTEQLASVQRSLGDARAERAQLLRQLAATSSAQEAAGLRARLRGVEARISSLASSLRSLTGGVDFTTIALTLSGEHSTGVAAPGDDLTPAGAVRDAGQILSVALAVLLLACAAALPLAVAALFGWIAVVSLRRRRREQALDAA